MFNNFVYYLFVDSNGKLYDISVIINEFTDN